MTDSVTIEHVSKSFGKTQAVADVSLSVSPGEIFGLLGPNGAGKTTLIRMVLDILRPDGGQIAVFGGPMTEAKKDRIGYLPEERGLYANIKLMDVILYLAALKGMARAVAAEQAKVYLERLDLWEHKDKKMSQLSRGMHQKAQFIVTILHDPDLIIVDEPFSGLDPVNTELIKKIILDLRAAGKAVIMSTHQMHQVETMCDRIVLIHRGEVQVSGPVRQVRQSFAGNTVAVGGQGPLAEAAAVQHAEQRDGLWHLNLTDAATPQQLLRELVLRDDTVVEHFEVVLPSLHDIFIQVVGANDA